MKISRTIVTIIVWVAVLVAKQFFGLDVDITEPADPEGDGLTLFELLNWILPIIAAYFRVRATQATNAFGVKTAQPLNQ